MPKIIENYVLERKIGSGQFGEVFKGYNKTTNQDVAVKVVKRELIKGKFMDLLENEIKVLRTCNNINIIKLYDLKKTQNNFYLVLEYCNEGDLSDYIKSKKILSEEEATEFFLQVLNAFKTLVKARIMHRDFKLANILKHNGMIKIADFGFSKLLGNQDFTQTMLGSPLNMAPEVLEGREYNNKADIWSIGTVFFEILFGKPPFTAGNIIDLVKAIKGKPLIIPKKINNISPVCEDVLRKMLTVDPDQRIDWEGLFTHKITSWQEETMKKELEETLKGDELGFSHFYINNNRVINHPSEINKRKDVNNFAAEMVKNKNVPKEKEVKYDGPIVKRKVERDEEEKIPEISSATRAGREEEKGDGELAKEETAKERQTRLMKKNSNLLLHERNKYVFLASVSEDAITQKLRYGDLTSFILVKKLFILIGKLKSALDTRTNHLSLEMWDEYSRTSDFKDISQYISQEYDVFKVYFESMYDKINNILRTNRDMTLTPEIRDSLNLDIRANINAAYTKILMLYTVDLINAGKANATRGEDELRPIWAHADQIIDCLNLDEVFKFQVTDKAQFNFKIFYEEPKNMDYASLIARVETKFKKIVPR